MKVWILIYQEMYETALIIGVFSTKECAEKAKDEKISKGHVRNPRDYYIDLYDVDDACN